MSHWLEKMRQEVLPEVHKAIFEASVLDVTCQILLLDDGEEARKLIERYPLAKRHLDDETEPPERTWQWDDWWDGLLTHEREEVRAALLYGLAVPRVSGWETAVEMTPKRLVQLGPDGVGQVIYQVCAEVTLYELIVSQITELVRVSRGVDAVVALRDTKGRGLTAHQVTKTLRGEWDQDALYEALDDSPEWWARRYGRAIIELLRARDARGSA